MAKDVEILVLRHQLAVLQRSSPKPVFTRGDRAVIAALLRLLSKRHRLGLKPLITPLHRAAPARKNGTWGYRRIHGELRTMGWKVAASTVWEILKKAQVDPAPQRADRSWSRSLKARAQGNLTVDVLHMDTVFLRRLFVLFFIEHGTRRVHIAGVTRHVTAEWVTQQARNILMSLDDVRTAGTRYLIRDKSATSPRPSTRSSPPSVPGWCPSCPARPA
ncbi:hypothetical protein ACFVY1_32045 [Streptomyces sp. NPDC058293]|uniref:hypothetical protein n=1 Tax=Streptomyces sp. NPDC058293 TaxID=3346429 RepID=UPI0036E1957C